MESYTPGCNLIARITAVVANNNTTVALPHTMPAFLSQYHSAYLTSGCFSPTRAGVFFVTRMDGVVDIWDYFYRQNEVAYSHKVGVIFILYPSAA